MANIVAIVGRPNVGKSTLFNRLIEERRAIMDNESGVTRDRHYGYAEWCGKHFTVVDTGGYVEGSEDIYEEAIRKQVKIALEECSVILFMVDCSEGLTELDKDFGNLVRQIKKPTYIIANKADTNDKAQYVGEFYALGLGEIFTVSSQNGSGTGEVLDLIVQHLESDDDLNPEEGIPRFAIVGRPNVGKSSFLNALLGQERTIVTDMAGTTRDSVNTRYTLFNKDFILTDTAGIRKKAKVKEDIEFYSVLRSIKALEDADVCIIMLDAERGLEAQDVSIIALADKNKKGIVILVNKWDLVEKENNTARDFEDAIRHKIAPMNYMPIIFTSVINKQRIFKAIETAVQVYENKTMKIPTSKLNDVMLKEIEAYPPPAIKGKYIRIKYVTQLPTKSPTFAFFCNLPQYIKEPYERYLENKMRSHFGFDGVPIKLIFRKK